MGHSMPLLINPIVSDVLTGILTRCQYDVG